MILLGAVVKALRLVQEESLRQVSAADSPFLAELNMKAWPWESIGVKRTSLK